MSYRPPSPTEPSCLIEVSDSSRLPKFPLVSVLMLAYNHERYLAEAIESIVAQQCDFPFELVVGEDASTDGTLQVALNYQKLYPEIIRVVHSTSNVGMNANGLRVFECSRGRYIAFCEGDDFWCALDKLAQQVRAIEETPEIGIVHTDWTKAKERGDAWRIDVCRSAHRRVPDRFLQGDLSETWYFPKILRTCTTMVRRSIFQGMLDSGTYRPEFRFGDSILNAFATTNSQVGYIPKITAVYRVSPNSALRSGAAERVAFYRSCLLFDSEARAQFAGSGKDRRGYRWESAAGLLVWGARACDPDAVKHALRELKEGFTLREFLVNARMAVVMRCPTLRPQTRELPARSDAFNRRR